MKPILFKGDNITVIKDKLKSEGIDITLYLSDKEDPATSYIIEYNGNFIKINKGDIIDFKNNKIAITTIEKPEEKSKFLVSVEEIHTHIYEIEARGTSDAVRYFNHLIDTNYLNTAIETGLIVHLNENLTSIKRIITDIEPV